MKSLLPFLGVASTTLALTIPDTQQILGAFTDFSARETCPQAAKVAAPNDGLHDASLFLSDAAFRSRQAKRLSRAVQAPTAISDYMVDPYDPAFEPFVEFQEYLEETFPLVHSRAKVEHVNRLGLLFTLQGSDTAAKPLLFMAHQDVVPIDDPSDWTHPPFAGIFDGEWIWGRGASDCKNVLIGLLSVVEELLEQDWAPQRTVVLAFGYDEESHGFLGAGALSSVLEERYGKDSFEFVLDEGGMGLQSLAGDDEVVYALPGVGEKGSIDLVMEMAVPGGHSSVPPAHTGIGIMAEILYSLERQELFSPWLHEAHPAHGMLECQARYSPERVEPWLADKLAAGDAAALGEAVASSRGAAVRYLLQTSQAADLIRGGVKTNALPEKISATVNYRVALHQTPDELVDRALRIISPIAESHNLTVQLDFPDLKQTLRHSLLDDDPAEPERTLTLSSLSVPLMPAPISPTDPLSSKTWAHFAGVTRSVFESHPNPLSSSSKKKPTVVVTGDVMTGNTDTRFYWPLSRNIYRWSPSRVGGAANIHTVDERIRLDVHLEGMMLYYDLIRSFDGWDE
ncbi:hypothetical protein N7510_000712 [Penicillium lagena]|uniref:uncharacterized protein n=1 Tax=Penicillium lagena TaxID=94218 RepID=UPI0025402399|nr:uncharacterized protein N7510_000712 [Penicillium lagena]KAJ5624403.1 hypothetical protein N7510_000712 [Penicillium lagena]